MGNSNSKLRRNLGVANTRILKAQTPTLLSKPVSVIVSKKQDEFKNLCSKQKNGNDADKNLLIQILCARIKPTKIKKESVARADVTVKKILRTGRYFYDLKLDGELHYKAKRNKAKQRFLTYTDFLVEKYFDKEIMKLFGFTKFETISNHLAALIQPKCLQNEMSSIKGDIDLLRTQKTKEPDTCPRILATQKNLLSSWENNYRKYIERMSDVDNHSSLARVLLYSSYNKVKFDEFTSVSENLIILENFLRKSNFLISTAVGGQEQQNNKRANNDRIFENLKKQVKPRDRKVLFPDEEDLIQS